MIAPPKPPSNDELEDLIPEARQRQLRRRLRIVAVIALTTAAGLVAYALIGRQASSRANAGHSPSASTAADCGQAHLSASFNFGAASGLTLGGVSLHNTGPSTCRLPVRPTIHLAWSGKTLNLHNTPLSPQDQEQDESLGQLPVSVLRPGEWAFAPVWWSNWCGPRPRHGLFRPRITVGLLGGSVLARLIPRGLTLPRCGSSQRPSTLAIGRFLTPLPDGWPH